MPELCLGKSRALHIHALAAAAAAAAASGSGVASRIDVSALLPMPPPLLLPLARACSATSEWAPQGKLPNAAGCLLGSNTTICWPVGGSVGWGGVGWHGGREGGAQSARSSPQQPAHRHTTQHTRADSSIARTAHPQAPKPTHCGRHVVASDAARLPGVSRQACVEQLGGDVVRGHAAAEALPHKVHHLLAAGRQWARWEGDMAGLG